MKYLLLFSAIFSFTAAQGQVTTIDSLEFDTVVISRALELTPKMELESSSETVFSDSQGRGSCTIHAVNAGQNLLQMEGEKKFFVLSKRDPDSTALVLYFNTDSGKKRTAALVECYDSQILKTGNPLFVDLLKETIGLSLADSI